LQYVNAIAYDRKSLSFHNDNAFDRWVGQDLHLHTVINRDAYAAVRLHSATYPNSIKRKNRFDIYCCLIAAR
jgi:hypothetical protein